MVETLRCWFFPERMRFLPGTRAMSIAFRTLHLAAFGILIGGHAFELHTDRLLLYLWLSILRGVGLLAREGHARGVGRRTVAGGVPFIRKAPSTPRPAS